MNTRHDQQDTQKSLLWEHSQALPPFFAENILYLEMEVECNNVTIEVVNQLLELYRIGVEYFESIKSNKFLIFKNKTQQLLMRGTVNQCMNVAYEELKHETALKKSKHVQGHDILLPISKSQYSFKILKIIRARKSTQIHQRTRLEVASESTS